MASRYNVRTPITLLDSEYSFQANENELILDSKNSSLIFKQSETEYIDIYDNLKTSIVNTFGSSGGYDPLSNNWIYQEDDDYVYLNKYIGSAATIVVPSSINGKMTKISSTAFTSSNIKAGILSIVFEEGCQADTMEGMFNGLLSLRSISNPPASRSFANTYKNTAIEVASIPEGTINAANAFSGCKNLKVVSIPNSITNMSGMYRGCVNLTEQYNSESARDMNYAYYGCKNIVDLVTVPNLVKSMISTYEGCTNIKGDMVITSDNVNDMTDCFANTDANKIKYIHANPDTLTRYAAGEIDGKNGVKLVYSSQHWNEEDWKYELADDNTYLLNSYVGSDRNVIIPSVINSRAVMVNGVNMFANNPTLRSVQFEDNSIKYFGNTVRYMYRNCTNLVSVPNLQEGLTDMSYIYYGCKSLRNVPVIPNSISNVQFSYAYTNIPQAPVIPTMVDNLYFTFAGTPITRFNVVKNNIKNISYTFAEATKLTGDIVIEAEDIPVSAMRNCFLNTSLPKDVYVPYVNTGDSYANTVAAAYHNSFGIFDKCGVTVHYASENWDPNEWDYDETDEKITLNKYIGSKTDVTVPGGIDNKKVYSKGGLFCNNQTVQTVEYEPGSYISNLTEEFFSCTNLTEVKNLPHYTNNMTNAFAEDRQLLNVPELNEGIENITGMCRNCASLITLPNVPTTVSQMSYAFYGADNSRGDVYIKSNKITGVNIYGSFGGNPLYLRRVHVPARGMNVTHNTATAAFNTVYGIHGKNNVIVLTDL